MSTSQFSILSLGSNNYSVTSGNVTKYYDVDGITFAMESDDMEVFTPADANDSFEEALYNYLAQ